jgi:hypothetical protein
MTKQVQLRRGTTAEHQVFTGAVGELTIDTTLDVAVVHDGITTGGHYLVGTGYGATVTQGMVNKTFLGINTATTTLFGQQYGLVVVGESLFEGNILTRSLDIVYDPTVEREGTLSDTNPLVITGIATNNIKIGYSVEDASGIIFPGTLVSSIGISSITIDSPHSQVGIGTTLITFTDPLAGNSNLYNLDVSNLTTIAEAGITTSYTQDAYINSGIITSAGISTAAINDIYINSGIITTVGISTASIEDVYINSGVITSATITSATVASIGITESYTENAFINVGIITTAGIATALVGDAFINTGIITTIYNNLFATDVGIVTNLISIEAVIGNAYISSGVVTTTDANTNNLLVGNAYVVSGVITDLYATVSSASTAYFESGISTNLNSTNISVNSGYIVSGIITNLQSTNSYINSGIVTTLSSEDSYIDVGIVTTLHTTNGYASTLRVNTGISTDLVVTGFTTVANNIGGLLSQSNKVEIGHRKPYNIVRVSGAIGVSTDIITGIGTQRIVSSITKTGVGSSYNDGSYVSVASTTNGSGTGAKFNLNIVSGDIETISIESGGQNYNIGDSIFLDSTNIGSDALVSIVVSGVSTLSTGQGISGQYIQKDTLITGISTNEINISPITTNTGIITDTSFETYSLSTLILDVTGNARVSGILTVGVSSLTIDGILSTISGVTNLDSNNITADRIKIDSPLEISYQGTLSFGNTNFISGISTENIIIGYGVTNVYLSAGTEVVSIGSSSIELNTFALNNIPTQTTQGYVRIGGGLEIAGINTTNVFVGSQVSGTYVSAGTTVVSIGVGIVTVSQALLDLNGESTYSGIVTVTNSNVITGIATANIIVGQTVFADSFVQQNTTVVSVGSSEIVISKPTTQAGSVTLDFTFRLLDQFVFTYPEGAVITTDFVFSDKLTGLSTIPYLTGKDAIFSGIGSFDTIIAKSINLNAGAGFDDILVSGIATIGSVVAQTGIITDLSGTNLNYTGIASIGNVKIGSGSTDLIVNGNARVTGVLTVGQGSITIDGNTSSIVGLSSIEATQASVLTVISGTNLSYAGVSTLKQVGLTTLTFDSYNDNLDQDASVTIKTSTAGISSNYTLTLPPQIGGAGQVLGILPGGNGELGFTTAGLYEARYYVSALNGDDTYDGKALPVRTIRRAAQLASFNSFVIPGQRYLDAGDLLEANKDFIVTEAIAALNFNYENLSTDYPDYSEAVWKTKLGILVDNLAYDIRFGGNSKSIESGFDIWSGGTSLYDGEEEQAIYAYNYVKFIGQYVINNQTPPTLYQTGISTVSQFFDFTIVQDPNNINAFGFHVSKDARNLILANKLEIVDKSLAAIAVAHSDFYFPGEAQSNERSRFYDSYRLIQQNKQEIIDYAWAATVATYPAISATQDKCKRDLGYFVDAVSTDVFTGGNNYARSFVGFYFQSGAPLGNGLLGEETESVYAFQQAAVGMSSAITNQLTVQDLTVTADPATGSNTDPLSCANVRSTIATLTGIVTTAVSSGSTAGIGTTTNYGYFLITPDLNVSDSVGIGSTNIFGGRKCARDLNYIVDAVAQDISYDTNQHILYATKKYFDGAGNLTSNGLSGEVTESITAFHALRDLSKKAITNQLNNRDLTVIADPVTGFNTDPASCDSTQQQINSLVGILTSALESGSLVGIASTSIGDTDCADVRSALVTYVGIVTTIVGLGTTAAPETNLPETQSKPIAIFVEAGDYVEDNPIILYDDVAVIGDNLRNTIVRPQNSGKDLFRVRNGVYLTGFAMKDYIDPAGVPQYTFDYAVAFDDPEDSLTDRTGYATQLNKPIIFRSPYIQNCSILSFLGGNGILVDGSKVQSPNTPLIPEEAENPVVGDQPEQGKSMVAAAFTMVSFGGIGWRTINDGYAQVVSCFQIFCRYGSLTQSGGYLSITNSATNFGFYALRSTGFSQNSFRFDRGRIAATGTSGGLTTLKVVGLGRSEQDLYVCRFIDDSGADQTSLFKSVPVTQTFTGTASTTGGSVDIVNDQFVINGHPFSQGDSVIYLGDEQDFPQRVIGGLVSQNQYYVIYIDANTFRLSEDDSLTRTVNLTSSSTGIHTFTKNTQEFFASQVIDRHNVYQSLTIPGTQSLEFVSGRTVQQTVVGGTAVGYAYTWNNSTRQLVVSVEISEDGRRNFQVTNGTTNLTIDDHSGSPISTTISAVTGLSTYWSIETRVDSTLSGGTIINPSNLPETYRLHFHRPSIINSSSHTWEYSGSGTDYNALPQNGGKTIAASEQVSEGGGRVYSSGTNELGDFKIGDFIVAFNRTGNIIFNNTVTIGTLDSIRLSLSGGIAIEEFSSDGGLGDNESGGPLNSRISTQLAIRTFLSNRLGSFIDKLVSTNAVPNAVVQLNSIGQINADLIPPRSVNYYRALSDGGRTQLVNFIPATNLGTGDVVAEPTDSFVLITDLISQYIILDNDTIYNFNNGDQIVSVNSAGGASGIVTAPTTSGINTTILSFPNVGYGTTGLVRGVPLSLKQLVGGSGYTNPGIYTGVRFDISSGIGTGITGTVTVGLAGTVSQVAIQTGGYKFEVDDILTINDPNVIGGRSGGSNFTVRIGSVETRLYVALTGDQKFVGSQILPDYFADNNAVGYSTNIGIGTTVAFTPTDTGVGGSVDFINDRIVLGSGHPFGDGDPVRYNVIAGTAVDTLINNSTYYVRTVGVSSIELYTTYALVTKVDLQSSGTGTHQLTRSGFNTATDQIIFVNHPFAQGDPVRISGNTPTGITTGAFYFVGSVTENSFTLHETRTQALNSINGLLLNTIDISQAAGSVGIMTLTEQNVEYTSTVNTSSNNNSNWSLLSSSSLDAANIITGIFNPSRLGTGVANDETFLRGDSSYRKVITSVGIGTTAGFDVKGYTSVDFAPGGVGINTYYGDFVLSLNRVTSTIDDYSTLGIAQFKSSTFNIGDDGRVTIKNTSQGGDVDAATLGGNSGTYYLDVANHQGNIPISRGGTGLTGLPVNGSILQGNGTAYNLTTTPEFIGDVTFNAGAGAITLSANSDIRFTTGSTWSGEAAAKIQFHNNNLYLQYTTNLYLRNSSGNNRFTLDASGNTSVAGTLTGTRLISNIANGTAPLTVTSSTLVTNLNADLLDGIQGSSFLRSDDNDTSSGVLTLTAGNNTTSHALQLSNGYLNIPHDEALIKFDEGQKMITSNDGQGNFAIKTGHNQDAVHVSTTSGNSGIAAIVMDSDGVNGSVHIGLGPARAGGSTANFDWGLGLTRGVSGLTWKTGSNTIPGSLATSYTIWHSGNDGSGSGLDADTLDGVDSASFLRSDQNDTFTNLTGSSLTIGAGVVLSESTDRADLLEITSNTSGWGGLQIRNSSNEGRWSFMTDGENAGIYNDEDDQWQIYFSEVSSTWLYFNGAVRFQTTSAGASLTGTLTASTNVTANSDIRLKTNITTIEDALKKTLSLRGVTFDRVDVELPRQLGVIAQEVEEVFPEVVHTDEDGIKSVAYGNLTAVLIEAIKEQQKQIDELREEIKNLKNK